MEKLPDWVSIGYINGAHGIRGEVRVQPLTDNPQPLALLEEIFLVSSDNKRQIYQIESTRSHQQFILLKLKDVETRNDAEALKGFSLEVDRETCVELPADHYYHFELIGLRVESTQHEYIGTITQILEMPANDVYVVGNEEREYLIPAIKDVVKQVDKEKKMMVIEVLEGLLD